MSNYTAVKKSIKRLHIGGGRMDQKRIFGAYRVKIMILGKMFYRNVLV